MATRLVQLKEWVARQPTWVKAVIVVGGAIGAGAVAVIAAPAVGAAVSALGFGAGAACTGAAASSAGLAALGGGSIAAGGGGIAAGTMVVGGVGSLAGGVATGVATYHVHRAGARSSEQHRRAKETFVDDDEFVVE
jgi:hypothetical protein